MLGWLLKRVSARSTVGVVEGIANVVDQFVETPDEKAAAEAIKARLAMQPALAQQAINKIEASHRSIFVAGWRPYIGWVCGLGLTWHYIAHDIIAWYCALHYPDVAPPELSGADNLITILLALLGMAGVRSVEKMQGLTK